MSAWRCRRVRCGAWPELTAPARPPCSAASAVLHGPRLIFLDEPASGVDPAGRRDFWALIRELSAGGTTVTVTTHVMAEAKRCDRAALIAEGPLLACGPPASPRAATGTIVAVIEAGPWQRAYAQLAARWPATTLRGTTIRVSLPAGADPRSPLAQSLATVRLERIHATDPSFRRRLHLVHQAQPPRHGLAGHNVEHVVTVGQVQALDHLGRQRRLRGTCRCPTGTGSSW